MGLNGNLAIWQQNVNKSPTCQHDLLSSSKLLNKNIDIVAIQEPALNAFNHSIASREWIPIYPSMHTESPDRTRALTLMGSHLNMDNWCQLDFPSGDVTVVQFTGERGTLTLFNIYNDGNSNDTLTLLTKYHRDNWAKLEAQENGNYFVIWLGDFNRHHPHWDDPRDSRLFTNEAITAAEGLISALAEVGLDLTLPSGTPTHCHNVTKRWTMLDHVFISEHAMDRITTCDALTHHRGVNTDHLPILTELDLSISTCDIEPPPNFRGVEWEEFRKTLAEQLDPAWTDELIHSQEQLDQNCSSLMLAIQRTIEKQVPVAEITPKSKRWWTKDLTQLRKRADKLGRQSYKQRHEPDHVVHSEHMEAKKRYEKTIHYNKKQHWRDWLEKAEEPDIWTANRYTSAPASDGGKTRIPTLRYVNGDQEVGASTNDEKSVILAKGFFPTKPPGIDLEASYRYPKQCRDGVSITVEQIQKQLQKLKPYKAPGPDGIPNIVLTKCADLLIPRLHRIYEAMYLRSLIYKPWKCFTTVVLRKPGKPRYDVPKAYRPIALLNTMWKVLTGIVAEQLSYLAEKHQLLPANHFGGRPGRTTTDAMHLLANTIKASWRAGKVTSVLFLDIEGAFPNAVPSRLVHNMRKRQVPRRITSFVHNMLEGRVTTLRFDGYTSKPIDINNGIGQGDPLSMVLYQFYNADLLDIPENRGEVAIAYVDDSMMIASATTFMETHQKLVEMMGKKGGVTEWSRTHNSPLEYSKLALIDFAHRCSTKERAPLHLPQIVVPPSESTKYLGVYFDQNLNWKAQHAHAAGKATKWVSQIKRLTRPTWGIRPSHARRLYISVAIPKVLYAADVWCVPKGSSKVTSQLVSMQRMGTLAITGGLRSSPTDALDANAFLIPMPLLLDKHFQRAAI